MVLLLNEIAVLCVKYPLIFCHPQWNILKEINPEYSLEGLMLKLKLQYFGHLLWKANSLEKNLMLGKTEGRRRRRRQRMRWLGSITASMDTSLSKLKETVKTGKRGVLQSTVSQSLTRLSNWTTKWNVWIINWSTIWPDLGNVSPDYPWNPFQL